MMFRTIAVAAGLAFAATTAAPALASKDHGAGIESHDKEDHGKRDHGSRDASKDRDGTEHGKKHK